MYGTLFNVATVLVGSGLGVMIGNRLSERYLKIVFAGLGLFTIALGVNLFFAINKGEHFVMVIFSLVFGGLLGEYLQLEKLLERFGDLLKQRFGKGQGRFTEGFITSFILFCVGSMTIMGAIEEGLGNEPSLLITKSVLDGFSSMALASAMGIGVMFSVIPLLIYQGGLTLFAAQATNFFDPLMVALITATGGVMIIGIGLGLLDIKKLPITNLLPALLFAVLFARLYPLVFAN